MQSAHGTPHGYTSTQGEHHGKETTIGGGIGQKAYKQTHLDIHHNGQHIGHVKSYNGYVETRTPGRTYVNTRKDAVRYQASLNAGLEVTHPNMRSDTASWNHTTAREAIETLQRMHANGLKQREGK